MLAAVVATVVATLILNSLSGDEPVETVADPEPPSTQGLEADPASTAADTVESADTSDAPQLLLTTYVWEDGAGWIEHASWVSNSIEETFVPVLSAWNWTPDYPAVTVRFDDFETSDSNDDFENERLSSIWTSQPTSGVTADIEDGKLLVSIPEGLTEALGERRVDLFHNISVAGDFEISVRFDVNDEFFSVDAGGLSLSIVGTQEFQALLMLQGNSYQSQEFAGSTFRSLAGTSAQQQSGGLRIKAIRIDD